MTACIAGLVLLFVARAAAQDPPTAEDLERLGIHSDTAAPPVIAPTAGPTSRAIGPYHYDGSGNITAIGTQSFLYDLHGRLVDARDGVAWARTYAYDSFGNMIVEGTESGTTFLTTSSTTNHLASMSAAYDIAGNVIQLQPPGQTVTFAYQYDALNMLQQVKASNVNGTPTQLHVYTADDQRYWTYDLAAGVSHWKIRGLDGKVLRDFKVTGTTWQLERDYVYRDGLLLAAVTPTNTLHFSLDHLGSPRYVTNAAGNRVGTHYYLPFGQEWTAAPEALQEGEAMKFTGHERDRDPGATTDGMDYMHARYYEAGMGRFLSVDPVLGNPGQPQSWNRYAYALNNPLRYTDPRGQSVFDIFKVSWWEKKMNEWFPPKQLPQDDPNKQALIEAGYTEEDAERFANPQGAVDKGLNKAQAVIANEATTEAATQIIGAAVGGLVSKALSREALLLRKSLASRAQMSEAGEIIAGAGARAELRDASRLVSTYGGDAADWVKMRSSSYTAPDGVRFETHWYQNIRTGERFEFKTKFQ